ncbi:LPS export ABC transporter permease LptG [Thiomicrorhabdus sp. 6S3-12]|uniref:LPS export ABC transporter permease LptG n=1 Tax=Thiomicrorhabdus sp. 6S3-12 TaxID=2819681 RepID=UPI001AAD7D42|nr:LPS export ABC transporter permease LptG [Thiomicrorhabdus sp. 6S3-12]MBO1923034.1 LPS export ABC transporter permease LptG [Thiomicrorhabdus sp. 6S3-12]
MNLTERYLGKTVISFSLLVLMVLVALLSFFEALYQFGKVNESFTFAKATLFVALKIPGYFSELFPVALLIGTLMGLGSLANHGELTVLRVTGWSIRRILFAVAKSAFLLWLVIALIGEYVAPQSESYAQKMRIEALNKSLSLGNSQGFWVKDGERYIHIGRVVSAEELRQVTLYHLKEGRLQKVQSSPKVVYDERRGWKMQQGQAMGLLFTDLPDDLSRVLLEDNAQLQPERLRQLRLKFQKLDQTPLGLPFAPDDLAKLDMDSRYLSLVDLYAYIQFLQQNELDAGPYLLDFWRKLAMPLVAFAMLAIVFPLIFGSQRQISTGQRVFVGIVVGLGFQLVNMLIGNLALVYQLPIALGAFLPALILLAIALLWMRRLP